tara:strand:- start:656 stop:1420 length:765 start_codon:yes stop_codon:yes gene_type:complete
MDLLTNILNAGTALLKAATQRRRELSTNPYDPSVVRDPGPSFSKASNDDWTAIPDNQYPEGIPKVGTEPTIQSSQFALPLEQQAIVNTIRDAEGTYKEGRPEGYATWFGGRVEPGLLSMTIDDVVKRQKEEMAKGSSPSVPGSKDGSYAVGGGQFLYPEMSAKWAGLDPSKDLFSPNNQNKMIIEYLKREGQLSDEDLKDWTQHLQHRAGRSFASIKTPDRNYGQNPKDFSTMQNKFKYHLEKERQRRAKLAQR